MNSLISDLSEIWKNHKNPFLVSKEGTLTWDDIVRAEDADLSFISPGQVVALIGGFDSKSLRRLLKLLEAGAIVVPLTQETRQFHDHYFSAARVEVVIENHQVRHLVPDGSSELLSDLRSSGNAGLILFSSGTTGPPKAILHDFSVFVSRFRTPRPTWRTLNFLLFDHIGGLNTLFHTIFNRGLVISPESRSPHDVIRACKEHKVELLPTSPTFLRMLLMSDLYKQLPNSVRLITYGTEKMDEGTLRRLCEELPNVDFRQTYGMSELGILRCKSESRDSLFMRVGGQGVQTKIIDDELLIRSQSRMLGYLNAQSPFDDSGWYRTGDTVVEKDGYIKIVGRVDDLVNIGGLKFNLSDVDDALMKHSEVLFAKSRRKSNPITGNHVESSVELVENSALSSNHLSEFLSQNLPRHMVPSKIKLERVEINHRMKKS